MPYKPSYNRKKGAFKWSAFLPMVLFFLLLIGVSFYAGVLWQRSQQEAAPSGNSGSSSSSTSSSTTSSSSSSSESSGSSDSDSSTGSVDSGSSDTSSSEPESTDPTVPESEYAPLSYFDDAVFIGDSVSYGLSYYGVFPAEQVLAEQSVNLETVLYKTPFTDTEGNYVSAYDAVVSRHPNKVYIMLGANGIEWLSDTKMIEMYDTFLTKLLELLPDADFFIQSVLPVTKALDENPNRDLTNAKINTFNADLKQLAKSKGVHYLDVASAFKDENGYLPDEASPQDGMHFSAKYYQTWLEYLRYHAVGELPREDSSAGGDSSDATGA